MKSWRESGLAEKLRTEAKRERRNPERGEAGSRLGTKGQRGSSRGSWPAQGPLREGWVYTQFYFHSSGLLLFAL